MLIDVHAHFLSREYTAFAGSLGKISSRPASLPLGDSEEHLKGRLQMMDEAGVAVQVLSPVVLPVFPDENTAVNCARLLNDTQAALIRRAPDRLRGYVSLPLPHIDASVAEMRRGLDELGFAGVVMPCSVSGRSIAESEYAPLYEEMNRRRAVLFVHPCVNGICSALVNDFKLAAAFGTSLEDALIVLQMIVLGIPRRFPDVKIIVPHLGGPVAMLLNRLDNQLPYDHHDFAEPPSVTAKRFWYDTVGHGSKAALRCAVEAYGADRLVPGSDFPVLLAHETYAETMAHVRNAGLPTESVSAILELNAAALFDSKINPLDRPAGGKGST
jgi:predicted TIM-barrel fold metal-dependent hydrolase